MQGCGIVTCREHCRDDLCMQDCHIDIKEEDVTELMVEEGFCHEAEAIMRVDTFKRCLLHVSSSSISGTSEVMQLVLAQLMDLNLYMLKAIV